MLGLLSAVQFTYETKTLSSLMLLWLMLMALV